MPIIDDATLARLAADAAARDRRRLNLNLHTGEHDPVQRFLNALQPDSYVRPHRHTEPPRWELFIALRGAAACLLFTADGRVTERYEVSAAGPLRLVEIPAGAWHTVVALEPDSVVFELKEGPYAPTTDKDFAPWAPREGEPECSAFVAWYRGAEPGSRAPLRKRS